MEIRKKISRKGALNALNKINILQVTTGAQYSKIGHTYTTNALAKINESRERNDFKVSLQRVLALDTIGIQ